MAISFIGNSNDRHFPSIVKPGYDERVHEDYHPDALTGVFLLAREMRRQIHELMTEEQWAVDAGFRPPCLGALDTIARHQPVSQRQISDHLGLDASDVVGVLDILEAAHMVRRQRDPGDRRRHAVVLTELGETAARRFAALRQRATERALAELDDDERRQLVDLLNRATGRLTSEGGWVPAKA
jgi:DNA-binding MarR family transcriptional regulator